MGSACLFIWIVCSPGQPPSPQNKSLYFDMSASYSRAVSSCTAGAGLIRFSFSQTQNWCCLPRYHEEGELVYSVFILGAISASPSYWNICSWNTYELDGCWIHFWPQLEISILIWAPVSNLNEIIVPCTSTGNIQSLSLICLILPCLYKILLVCSQLYILAACGR